MRRGLGLARSPSLSLVLFLGVMLFVRVLTDDLSSPDSRYSGSLNLSSAIAITFILLAVYLLFRRRRGVLPTVLAALWLCIWVAIAVNTNGASTETLREGVREISVVALFVIVYNARGAVTVSTATRLVQLIGFIPAGLALYQLATHTGMNIDGELRSNGTLAHPDSAAMFFAMAATASLWQYLDNARRRFDALFTTLFAAALIATSSIDGLITLVVMLMTFGALRPGPVRANLILYAIAGIVVLAFFASPLGAHRVAKESSTSLAAAERGETNSPLDTRLYRWKTLLPEWEKSPLIGQGLGTTTTAENTLKNPLNSLLPHNEYLRYLVETGVIGIAILLTALAILLRHLLSMRRRPGEIGADTVSASTLALTIIVGCLVNSLVNNTLLNSPICYAAALILAAVLSLPAVKTQRASIPQTV